jgi:hypothetical protein
LEVSIVRKTARSNTIRARLQSDRSNRLDVVIEPGIGRFSCEKIDVVLRELLKVREIIA